MEDAIRAAIYEWIRDDAPIGLKMMMQKDMTDSLLAKVMLAVESIWVEEH